MYFLNLSAAELLSLFGILSGVVTALYLLDRTKRKQTVATLRFWSDAVKPTETRRRRRIRQPLSLALQVLAILCLLLALAQLRWGTIEDGSRDHVLVLDTSAWMAARTPNGLLMDEARRLALAYVRALPAGDRIMLLRAGALTTPVTAFESDRQVVEKAILASEAGAGALRVDDALRFARRIQTLHAQRSGEIAFAGRGRTAESDSALPDLPNLRLLLVKAEVENAGLRKVTLRPLGSDETSWEIYVAIRNYAESPRQVDLGLQFAGSPAGFRKLTLQSRADAEATFPLRTRAAGQLDVRLFPGDDFTGDDRVVLELPARRAVRVAVYSDRPDLLRPLLQASPFVQAGYFRPRDYKPGAQSGIVILDAFRPSGPAPANAIWIEPPSDNGLLHVKTVAEKATLRQWHSDHTLASGLRTEDLVLNSAIVFHPSPAFEPIAEVAEGPVILASAAGSARTVVLGFHPMRSSMRYEVAAPLLFGNIIQWMDSGVFRRWEVTAESVGSVEMRLEDRMEPADVRVIAGDGRPLPATVHSKTLRFFSGVPGVVRVTTRDREMVYSLSLPDFSAAQWTPPPGAAAGLPRRFERASPFTELWHWLALLGGLLLLVEWMWFGRFRRTHLRRHPAPLGLELGELSVGRTPWSAADPLVGLSGRKPPK
jgi:hypothetical protein